MIALVFLIGAKVASVSVPLLLKRLVDALNISTTDPRALLVVPLGLLLGYAGLRLAMTLFTELREIVFARATFGAAKRVALETFEHLHALSLRFHLERQTGGLTRDIERGTRGAADAGVVLAVHDHPDAGRAHASCWCCWATSSTSATCGSRWPRCCHLRHVHDHDHRVAHQVPQGDERARLEGQHAAIDALLNFETVKYFNNEQFESARYETGLEAFRARR
jgi:hypothetical protein